MSKLSPTDEFVLNHGNPNSADYKRTQARLELSKLDELRKLNRNDEEYVRPYVYGIHPVLDFFHKIAEVFCNVVTFALNSIMAVLYLVGIGFSIYWLFMIFFGK